MVKKINIMQEKFNETEMKNEPDFKDKKKDQNNLSTIGPEKSTTEAGLMKKLRDKRIRRKSMNSSVETKPAQKELKITVKDKDENDRYDNDPISYEKVNKAIEREKNKEIINSDVNEFGFNYCLFDEFKQCFGLCRAEKGELAKKLIYYEKASSVIDYYSDVVTYFKKMLEIDIIKYYIFSKEERKLINYISCPDFSEIERQALEVRLDLQYYKEEPNVLDMEQTLQNILKEARNKGETSRLLNMIQVGHKPIIEGGF